MICTVISSTKHIAKVWKMLCPGFLGILFCTHMLLCSCVLLDVRMGVFFLSVPVMLNATIVLFYCCRCLVRCPLKRPFMPC